MIYSRLVLEADVANLETTVADFGRVRARGFFCSILLPRAGALGKFGEVQSRSMALDEEMVKP